MSPRTKKQFKAIREERVSQILNTSLELFATEGFHTTSISDIAARAGVAKGLIYHYFESKDDLLTEILGRSLAEIYMHLDPDGDGRVSEDEFEMFIQSWFHLLEKKRNFWKLFFTIIMHSDVQPHLMKADTSFLSGSGEKAVSLAYYVGKLVTDYFMEKKKRSGPDYDPHLELIMFSNVLKGMSITAVFNPEAYSGDYYEKCINRIIKEYK